jgi:hypothetical protein
MGSHGSSPQEVKGSPAHMKPQHSPVSRRRFLRCSGWAAGGAAFAFPYVGKVLGANDQVAVACIGVGGKGSSDTDDTARCGGKIVALCDVDQTALESKATKYPDARQFRDYRKMLEEMDRSIDAVTVSTADHTHGVACSAALRLGKHVYCQKPLVQTVEEVRWLRRLAKEKGLATQMGNQGSASAGLRRAVEVIQSGIIGAAREVHVWSNRPIWPQGLTRPEGEDPVPPAVDWDLWLGPAAWRPYKRRAYHPFAWRGWYDFGTGALGDMACHTVNLPFRALKLGYPEAVECEEASEVFEETFPKTSRIRYDFAAREGLPAVKVWWYDGSTRDASLNPFRPPPELTREIVALRGSLPPSGCLIVGEKGKVFSPDDYGAQFYLIPPGETTFVPAQTAGLEHEAIRDIPMTIPRSPGHNQEWFNLMKDGTPAYSNFEVAGYLTEIVLLGCVALRVGVAKKMEWDGPNMHSPNRPEAARFLKREYRAPFKLS